MTLTEKLGIKPDPDPKLFIPDPDPSKSSGSTLLTIIGETLSLCIRLPIPPARVGQSEKRVVLGSISRLDSDSNGSADPDPDG